MKQLRPLLERLEPARQDRGCHADLGLRYVLVYTQGAARVGVSADDFGCQEVRLTDDPFVTVPGEATAHGTVAGVLRSSAGLLTTLKTIASSPAH